MGITKEDIRALIEETVPDTVRAAIAEAGVGAEGPSEDWRARILGDRDGRGGLPPTEKGHLAARVIRALAAGKGDPERAVRFAQREWGEDDLVVRALAAGDAEAGGFLLAPELSSEIIELLRPLSAVRRLNPSMLPMETGTVDIPKLAGGASAAYVGENANITSSQPKLGNVRLVWKKLATLVPISNDLLRFRSPGADAMVRDDIISAMATREDLAFIRDDGTQDTPKGIRFWAVAGNIIPANGTVNLANVTSDLGLMVLALENANVRMLRPAWLMAPRTRMFLMTVRDGNGNFAYREEMIAGRLWDFPFASTTQVPANLGGGTDESELYLVDMADVVIGEAMRLQIDASSDAAYFDGSQLQASFSRDQTVIRAVAEHDLVLRHAESVAVLTGVKWIP